MCGVVRYKILLQQPWNNLPMVYMASHSELKFTTPRVCIYKHIDDNLTMLELKWHVIVSNSQSRSRHISTSRGRCTKGSVHLPCKHILKRKDLDSKHSRHPSPCTHLSNFSWFLSTQTSNHQPNPSRKQNNIQKYNPEVKISHSTSEREHVFLYIKWNSPLALAE